MRPRPDRTALPGGDDVVAGPGENAGVVDIGDGLAVAVRNVQPPSVPRNLQRVQRDSEEQPEDAGYVEIEKSFFNRRKQYVAADSLLLLPIFQNG